MKNIKIFLVTLLMTVSMTSLAERVYIEDFTIEPGQTKQVALQLSNTQAWAGLGVDIELPEGLSIELNARGFPKVTINTERADEHSTTTNIRSNGMIAISLFTLSAADFIGNEGPVLYFNLTADATFKGTHSIFIRNIELVDANAQPSTLDDVECIVNPETPPVTDPIEFVNRLLRLEVGETVQLETNRTDLALTWSSQDDSIASVDDDGRVTAHKTGIVEIYASTADGQKIWAGVFAYRKGDVNLDNIVNVADVNIVVNSSLTQ